MERIAARGRWGSVEWAINSQRAAPARDYWQSLPAQQKAKTMALFRRFAEEGKIFDRTKFKKLGQKAKGKGAELWEFKSGQDRFLGDFRPEGRFVIAHALRKKGDNLPEPDIEKAVRILEENDLREKGRLL